MRLIHQTQPTYNTCVSTCLAMILNRPVNDVVNEFHHQYHSDDGADPFNRMLPAKYLRANGCECDDNYRCNDGMEGDGVYLVGVPSLNIVAGMHSILYVINEVEGGWEHTIYDPAEGREGKKFYVTAFADDETMPELAVKMNGYVVELKIELDQIKQFYKDMDAS